MCASMTNADESSHEKTASKLLDAMQFNELLAKSIDAMLELELQNNPSMKPYRATMKEFFETYMSGDSLRWDFIKLYTETFTEKEMKDIIAFYSTPVGRKTLTTAPDLMAKGAALGQQRVMENLGELEYMIEQESKRIEELQEAN